MNLPRGVEAAVARMRQTAAGAAALAGWIGEGAHPVDPELAEKRASICSACPQNVRRKKVENKIAEGIRIGEEARNSLILRTSHDHELKVCQSCGCYLPLKVWVPLKNQTEANFPDNCWVVKEKAAPVQPLSVPHVNPTVPTGRVFSIRRSGAFGDVIMASIIADKLAPYGQVRFSTVDATQTALRGHPSISEFLPAGAPVDVDLDNCYEQNPNRWSVDIPTMMIQSANMQLARHGIRLSTTNRVPNLRVFPDEVEAAEQFLSAYKRPYTMLIPRSGAWPSRRIRNCDLQEAAKKIAGTCFWAFPGTAPEGTVGLPMNTFRNLMAFISKADLVITPDTGPLFVAQAFNRKIIYLTTCNPSHLRITDLTDYTSIESPITCAGCGHTTCPKDAQNPPCNAFRPDEIAASANTKLESDGNDNVCAIITVYRTTQRLERCLLGIKDQVDQIIIAYDYGAEMVEFAGIKCPLTLLRPPKKRLGWGKNCNRAVRFSTCSNLLLLNDDCYLAPSAVAEMKKVMKSKNAGVVGSLLYYPDGTIQHGGCTRNHGDIGFGHRDHKRTSPTLLEPTEMESVTFASALVRKSLFFKIRGFDEEYDCYSEDADFCMRARSVGESIWYTPHAVGIHDESQSTSIHKSQMLEFGWKIFASKWSEYFRKNPPIR